MSATSNKSRILLFMMVIIALVFFISSFMAATLNPSATTPGTVAPSQGQGNSCVMVRTAEDRLFSECNFG